MGSKREKVEELLKNIPKEGFLKVTKSPEQQLDNDKRIALIRKGNELFNRGEIELAKRIFITTGYSDGLIRIGDLYMEQNLPLEAFRMYYMAPYPKKVNEMLEKMAAIVRKWLKEEIEGSDNGNRQNR